MCVDGVMQSPEEGASTGVFLATSPSVPALHGQYFDKSELGLCR
jgi:hypothetical protein